MSKTRKREFLGLLVGDVIVFVLSLYATLAVRALALPSREVFLSHLAPFSLLFAVWVLFFFIAGLYDRHTLLIKSKLPQRVLMAHLFNLVIATAFFYAIPYFGVTPKVTLFLYLFVSTILIFGWRFFLYPRIAAEAVTKVVIVAAGKDIDDLSAKLGLSGNSLVTISRIIDPKAFVGVESSEVSSIIRKALEADHARVVALDLLNPNIQSHLNSLYSLIFDGVQFVDVQDLYEDIMDKVPLGLINESWFLEHVSIEPNIIYDTLKRAMDIVIVLPLAVVTLFVTIFVWIAVKLEDGMALMYSPERIGKGNKIIRIHKFRTMSIMDSGNQLGQNANKITRAGKIMRVTRIDELPQLWNILRGDLSLIGPRPEFPKLVELYNREIPHYNVRHLIQPGLSGWAQIHHEKPPHSVEETVDKLAYDLYYIKHRSFMLDLKIALQTVKTLLSRVGV